MTEKRIPWTCFLNIFWRSFLLQASWNFDRLQNLGYFYLLLPGLRYLYGDDLPEEVRARHLAYFNTHPCLAPLVAGTTLRLEAKHLEGLESPVDVETYKKMVMAPFAAMGDALFWGGLRPLAAVIGLFLASQGSLWAPVVFLVIYNLPQLFFRIAGLIVGYTQGLRSVETVQRLRLPDLAIRLKEGVVVLLGVMSAYLAYKGCHHQEIPSVWGFSLLPVVLLFAWLAHKGVSSLFLVLLTTVGLLALALLF